MKRAIAATAAAILSKLAIGRMLTTALRLGLQELASERLGLGPSSKCGYTR